MKKYSLLIIIIILVSSLYGENFKSIKAIKIKSDIRIDGKLSEDVWEKAIPATNFLQKEPDVGKKASFKTEIRVLYDDKNLYIGIKCFDPEPNKIFAKQMERDGDFSSDDSISIIIDTYKDMRSGFLFIVNPNGAKLDSYITDEGKYENKNWNGIWDTKATITTFGWSAEIKIPFSTLKFNPEKTEWGINFRRFIARKNEEDLWTAFHRNEGIMLISKAGILKGISGIKRGNKINLKPYILSGIQKEKDINTDYKLRAGIDLKYSLTSSLTLDMTAHPDFGQVEVDRKRINLTRFSLFYPEKREFFLEGAGIFSFGIPGKVQPLYTRRIGLSPDRKEVPILGGARLTGKAGKYDIGIFNIETSRSGEYAPSNYSAVRVRREILKKSYVGFIATNRYTNGKYNSSLGVDGVLSFSNFLGDKNLIIGGFAAKTYDSDTKDDKNKAYQFYVNYPNNLFDVYFKHYVIEENFKPEIGFVYRTGIKRSDWQIKTRPRINKAGFKYFVFKIKNYKTSDLSGNLLEDFYEYRLFGFETRSGESFELNFQTRKELLDEDFEIYEGIIINQGMYKEKKWEIQFDTSKSRTLSAAFFYNFGDFYTGKRKEFVLEGRIKISRVFSLNIDYSYNDISLANGKFKTYEPAVWINFNPTTNFFTSAFLQYNNEDNELVANVRIHFIPKAKSHVYLVYSEILQTENRLISKKRTILLKIAYNF